MDPSAASYLLSLTASARAILGEASVGVYPHGSLMLGGWRADRSDVDVLVVVDRPLTSAEQSLLADDLVRGGAAMPRSSASS